MKILRKGLGPMTFKIKKTFSAVTGRIGGSNTSYSVHLFQPLITAGHPRRDKGLILF